MLPTAQQPQTDTGRGCFVEQLFFNNINCEGLCVRLIKPKYSPVLQIVPLTVFTLLCINHDFSQDFFFLQTLIPLKKECLNLKKTPQKTHVLILIYIKHEHF